MSAAPKAAPSLPASVASIARLSVLRLARGRKLKLALGAAALVVGAVLFARYGVSGVSPDEAIRTGLRFGFFLLLVPLVPFLFASDAIGEEVEGRTFPLLAVRASGRTALALGKVAAAWACGIPLLVGADLVMELACYAGSFSTFADAIPDLGRHVLAVALIGAAYISACAFLGALAPEAAGVLAAAYLVVVDLGFGIMPGVFRMLSMAHHARAVAGLAPGGLFESSVPVVPFAVSASLLVVAAIAFAAAAAFVVSLVEYRFRDQA